MVEQVCIARTSDMKSIAFETALPPAIPNKWSKSLITWAMIRGSDDIPGDYYETLAAQLALDCISIEIPVNFKRVLASQNPDFTIAWKKSTEDSILMTDPKSILAYAGFPQTSLQNVVVFNDDFTWDWSNINFHYVMHSTLRHELGHKMGIVHDQDCSTCMMYPIYNGALEYSKRDIEQLTDKYGVRNNTPQRYAMIKNWLYYRTRRPIK